MLESLHETLRILASRQPATSGQISSLVATYPSIPHEYLALVTQATEIELEHKSGQYLRIWGPDGCREMDNGYDISERIPGAIPIGDDGGGMVIFYMDGKNGFGLYHVGYGNLDASDAVFTAPSLTALLENAVGVDTF